MKIPDHEVINAMLEYGGGFMQQIAMAFRVADPENQNRIKTTWPDEWAKYAEFAKIARGTDMFKSKKEKTEI